MGLGQSPDGQLPSLPMVWVNNNEAVDGSIPKPNYELTIGSSTWTTGPPTICSGVTFSLPYPQTFAGIQAAVNDMEHCRSAALSSGQNACFYLDIPAGTYTTSAANGLIFPRTSATPANCFNVLRSTMDASLPAGRTVCSHGIQDNVPTSTDIGLHNPDCTGTNMYQELGPQEEIPVPFGGFTNITYSGNVATFYRNVPFPPGVTVGQFVNGLPFAGGGSAYSSFADAHWQTWFQVLSVQNTTAPYFITATPSVLGEPVTLTPPAASSLTLTGVTVSGTTATYRGSVPGRSNSLADVPVTITGFSHAGNNGKFTILASTATNFTVANASAQAETHAASASVLAGILVQDGTITGIKTISVNTTLITPVVTPGNNYVFLTDGYVSPGTVVNVCIASLGDTGCTPETVTTLAGPNQQGMIANFAHTHAGRTCTGANAGARCTPGEHVQMACVPTGCPITLANTHQTRGVQPTTLDYNDVQYMWHLVQNNRSSGVVKFCQASGIGVAPLCAVNAGADHWMLESAAFGMSTPNTGAVGILSIMVNNPTSLAQFNSHIHLQRTWGHGDWRSLAAGSNSVANVYDVSGSYISVADSQISLFARPGGEGHGFAPHQATATKIVHNWADGGAIGMICGGYAASAQPQTPGFITCTDMQVGRSRFSFPYSWLGMLNIPMNYNPWWNSTTKESVGRKNCLELKEVNRVVRYGLICENVDNSGGQQGPIGLAVSMTSTAGPPGILRGAGDFDILDSYNIWRNACEGWEIGGRSNPVAGDGNGVSPGQRRVWFHQELVYNVTNQNPGCASQSLGHYTGASKGLWHGNVTRDATGLTTFTVTCTGSLAPQQCPPAPPSASRTDPGGGQYSTAIAVGDPVVVYGCDTEIPTTAATLNTPTGHPPGQQAAFPKAPVTTLPGTLAKASNGLTQTQPQTVSWQGPAKDPARDTSGHCTLGYQQGFPYALHFTHHTFITNVAHTFGSPNGVAMPGMNYGPYALVRDSVWTGGGWFVNGLAVGTYSESTMFDWNSLTTDHSVWAGTTDASHYTEYGNNPAYPASSCTTTPCSISPPLTIYTPANLCSDWSTSVPGACTGTSQNLQVADYHAFEISPHSSFHAGKPHQASDGTDLGANIPALDQYQNMTTYVCPYACASPGPYSDTMTGEVVPPPQKPKASSAASPKSGR